MRNTVARTQTERGRSYWYQQCSYWLTQGWVQVLISRIILLVVMLLKGVPSMRSTPRSFLMYFLEGTLDMWISFLEKRTDLTPRARCLLIGVRFFSLFRKENLKGSLLQTKVVHALFFPYLPLAWSIFLKKDGWYPDTVLMLPIIDFCVPLCTFWSVIDARCYYRLKICKIGSKVYNGQQNMWLGISRQILDWQMGRQGKKKYCLQ